jgi:hypothetical protein
MKRRRRGSLLILPVVAALAVTPVLSEVKVHEVGVTSVLAEVKVHEVGWGDPPLGVFVGVADRDASAANGTVSATASQSRRGPARPGGRTTLDSEAPSSRFGTVNRSGSEARADERRRAAEMRSLSYGTRRKARVISLTNQ